MTQDAVGSGGVLQQSAWRPSSTLQRQQQRGQPKMEQRTIWWGSAGACRYIHRGWGLLFGIGLGVMMKLFCRVQFSVSPCCHFLGEAGWEMCLLPILSLKEHTYEILPTFNTAAAIQSRSGNVQ